MKIMNMLRKFGIFSIVKNLKIIIYIYLKVDTLLLADVFENFRQTCLDTYKVDPSHYFTTPGLAFDSLLKYTNVKLDYV